MRATTERALNRPLRERQHLIDLRRHVLSPNRHHVLLPVLANPIPKLCVHQHPESNDGDGLGGAKGGVVRGRSGGG